MDFCLMGQQPQNARELAVNTFVAMEGIVWTNMETQRACCVLQTPADNLAQRGGNNTPVIIVVRMVEVRACWRMEPVVQRLVDDCGGAGTTGCATERSDFMSPPRW